MKFEVGDKVIVKISNEEGIVREIINDKMVMVEVRNVKFPAYTDQLDFPYFKMFSQQMAAEKKPAKKYIDDVKREKKAPKYKVAEGVWLLFFPVFNKDVFDDDVVESLKIYLVNQTEHGFKFHFWLRFKGNEDLDIKNEIYALSDFYLMDVDFEHLNDNPSFDFEFSLLSDDKKKAEYYETSYKPKAKQVFKFLEDILKNGEAFFKALLFQHYPDRTKAAKEIVESGLNLNKLADVGFKVINSKKIYNEPAPPTVIDLHIEKLTDEYVGMSAHDKLTFQMNAFEKYLDKVELHFLKHITVIHGIGSGRLKDEIHHFLRNRPAVRSVVQQYHPWYGHGATEVYLK